MNSTPDMAAVSLCNQPVPGSTPGAGFCSPATSYITASPCNFLSRGRGQGITRSGGFLSYNPDCENYNSLLHQVAGLGSTRTPAGLSPDKNDSGGVKVNQHHRRETRAGHSLPDFLREALLPCADGAVNTVEFTPVSGGAGKETKPTAGESHVAQKGNVIDVGVGRTLGNGDASSPLSPDMAIRGGTGRRYVTVGTERDRTILLRGFSAATNEAHERGKSDCTEPCGVQIPAVSPVNPLPPYNPGCVGAAAKRPPRIPNPPRVNGEWRKCPRCHREYWHPHKSRKNCPNINCRIEEQIQDELDKVR